MGIAHNTNLMHWDKLARRFLPIGRAPYYVVGPRCRATKVSCVQKNSQQCVHSKLLCPPTRAPLSLPSIPLSIMNKRGNKKQPKAKIPERHGWVCVNCNKATHYSAMCPTRTRTAHAGH
eukprot:g62115.t1